MLEAIKKKINEYSQKYQLDLAYVIRNEFWVYLRYGISLVIGLAASIVFARLAPKEVYGQFNFIMAILGTVSIVSIPGLNTAVARSTALGNEGNYKQAVKTKFLWSLIGIPALLGVGAYYYYYGTQIIGVCLMVSSIFFPLMNAPNAWDSFLVGKRRFDLSATYGIIQSVVNAVAMIAVLFLNASNLLLIIITSLVTTVFLHCLFYTRSLKYVENQVKDNECIKYGYFLTGTSIIGVLGSYLDKIMIGTLLGAPQLAVYAIVLVIPNGLQDLTKTFWSPFAPKISKQGTKLMEVGDRLKRLILPLSLIVVVGSLLYWLFIDDVISFLYGGKYAEAGPYARILLLWLLITTPEAFLGTFIQAKKNIRAIVLSDYIFPFIGLSIIAGFIYFWGITGAVWAMVVTRAIRVLFMLAGMRGEEWRSG